jgi:hypothetical protein
LDPRGVSRKRGEGRKKMYEVRTGLIESRFHCFASQGISLKMSQGALDITKRWKRI